MVAPHLGMQWQTEHNVALSPRSKIVLGGERCRIFPLEEVATCQYRGRRLARIFDQAQAQSQKQALEL